MPAHSPRELHELFRDAANEGDIEALAALYETNPAFAPQPGEVASGSGAIRAHLADLLAMQPWFEKVNTTRVLEAGDVALICSDWKATATDAHGERFTMTGRGTEVARRQPDSAWLLVIDNPWGTA